MARAFGLLRQFPGRKAVFLARFPAGNGVCDWLFAAISRREAIVFGYISGGEWLCNWPSAAISSREAHVFGHISGGKWRLQVCNWLSAAISRREAFGFGRISGRKWHLQEGRQSLQEVDVFGSQKQYLASLNWLCRPEGIPRISRVPDTQLYNWLSGPQ